jgi:hypothetical protein
LRRIEKLDGRYRSPVHCVAATARSYCSSG